MNQFSTVTIFTQNIQTDYNKFFFTLQTFDLVNKISIFLMSEYLQMPTNYQLSRVVRVHCQYILIGVKINNLCSYVVFNQFKYMEKKVFIV